MGLGLPTGGGGDFVPYLKYNAKAGRWYTKNDAGDDVEVVNMTAVFDMPNIKTGLLAFTAGQAPEYIFDSGIGANDAVEPAGTALNFKRGFLMHVYAEKAFMGVREFGSTAGVVNDVMNTLWDAYDSAPEKGSGQLPIVACNGVSAIEGKHGTNYAPNLAIMGWTKRPAAFDELVKKTDATPAPANPVPAPAPAVPPPAALAGPVASGVSEF